MKTFSLILGAALFVLGAQDGIRLIIDSNQSSIFSWLPDETLLYIGLDVVLVIAGLLIAGSASRSKEKHLSKW